MFTGWLLSGYEVKNERLSKLTVSLFEKTYSVTFDEGVCGLSQKENTVIFAETITRLYRRKQGTIPFREKRY